MPTAAPMRLKGAALLGEPSPEFVRVHIDSVFHRSVEVNICVEFD
jgi:hypothetical protein